MVVRGTETSKNVFEIHENKGDSERVKYDVTVFVIFTSHCLCFQLIPNSMDVRYEEDIIWSGKKVEGLTLMNMRNFHPSTSQHLVRRLDIFLYNLVCS